MARTKQICQQNEPGGEGEEIGMEQKDTDWPGK